jgi:diketogulonate reductase-like aldo/keto reductase
MGYRHVDTAQAYDNERAVGEGIAAADVDREDVFLTTKVWRSNLSADDVHRTVRESLDRLDVDAVDLLLIHWPHPRIPVDETLGAMEELRDEGLVRQLGVSNFTRSQLADAIRVADSPIVANQVLYHPYKDQSTLLEFCRDRDVALTAYSPLARGAVVDDEVLAEIGERHGTSAAQVALGWLVHQDGVVAIPEASSRGHLEANRGVFDLSLSAEEMARIRDRRGSLGIRLRNRLPALMRRWPL